MFHDIFGHIPMLTDPAFSDFLVAYGQAGLRAEKLGASSARVGGDAGITAYPPV